MRPKNSIDVFTKEKTKGFEVAVGMVRFGVGIPKSNYNLVRYGSVCKGAPKLYLTFWYQFNLSTKWYGFGF